MILVDANVLLYAYEPRSEHHQKCRNWVEKAFAGEEPVCLAWVTILAFIRIITNPLVFESPLTAAEATDVVASWLARPAVFILEAGERRWELLRALLTDSQISGAHVMHAFLAALALENGATLVSTDREFSHFPTLQWSDPTAA